MGEYWFSEDVKFQCFHNSSSIAVKFIGMDLWRRSSNQERSICRRTKADVVHEEEAYLLCSSSDYDEHADLSTDSEDLADTDSEGSVHHLGIKPYQYVPYLSDAGAGEDGGSEDDGTGSDEDDEGSERLGNNKWLVAFYS